MVYAFKRMKQAPEEIFGYGDTSPPLCTSQNSKKVTKTSFPLHQDQSGISLRLLPEVETILILLHNGFYDDHPRINTGAQMNGALEQQ